MTKIEREDRKRNATNIDVKVNNDIVRPRKSLDEEMIKTESEAINKKVTNLEKELLKNLKIARYIDSKNSSIQYRSNLSLKK